MHFHTQCMQNRDNTKILPILTIKILSLVANYFLLIFGYIQIITTWTLGYKNLETSPRDDQYHPSPKNAEKCSFICSTVFLKKKF